MRRFFLALLAVVAFATILPETSPRAQNGATVIQARGCTYTNRSGSLAGGGTAVTVAAANQNRSYLLIQNPSTATQQGIAAAESVFVDMTATAVVNGANSIELLPGSSLVLEGTSVSVQGFSINATTANHRFIAKEC